MANHNYIISEVKFFQEKDNHETKEFLSGTEIDLDKQCTSIIPTIIQIEENIIEFGLKFTRNKNKIEATKHSDEIAFHLIFEEDIAEETRTFMFEIGRGSNIEILIDFIKYLGNSFGNFLLYCDSGRMTLITNEKLTKQILKEYNE